MNQIQTQTITWEDSARGVKAAKAMSGIEYLRAMKDGILPAPPIASLMDMRFEAIEAGHLVFRGRPFGFHYPDGTGARGFRKHAFGFRTGVRDDDASAQRNDVYHARFARQFRAPSLTGGGGAALYRGCDSRRKARRDLVWTR